MSTLTSTPTSTPVLTVDKLRVCYGKVEAISAISIRVATGSIVSVIGPNGAGKSTLLNSIIGMLPSSGEIRFEGQAVNALDVEERVQAGIALVPETRELFADMSVQDNLQLGSFRRYRERDKDYLGELDNVYRLFPRLKDRREQLAGTMSGGERQMLAIGRALMGKPRLLMLDEPSLGLAPLIVKEIFNIISGLRETGVATLLIEQNARAALQVSDYGYVIETGSLVLEGKASDLANDPKVIETYLGIGKARQAAQA
ncbi:ABC transporter ATP-binding protein [Herbaspirillum sp. RTI4]|uniref:ABC transporter ATP-binding protein n=1 Tax=Herbaspirillum sp. RTI4 TaxID=3048640 RepID=UPI002AB39052|nr:ABC transporter ATP-binding protein [Herbaspirillum sp. RTI4]MDY7579272.1 ABC transporter ATP-binding protein [Herbaspirillum sp. RTI4]MEA9982771.1 ABC transporter ATP-binding protein [Herbaspirillum sp. RTI4]